VDHVIHVVEMRAVSVELARMLYLVSKASAQDDDRRLDP
jgi:hypothetical protein